ncbi:hypothetical protein LV89_04170 [Arcicella aurantiaca]|uniref:Uncharacterized protein n=1 Tax=Arcicella aurantiaca TaxID=591202 RepID=A0A316DN36_9BACT|nr:hypothetical protein [Arcicella aurantiaca]PWK18143.1 hypothetical protein LV89_04170 [Arcicella aurantiaca]
MKKLFKNNPLIVISVLLLSVVTIITYSRNLDSSVKSSQGFFSGKISFDSISNHKLYSDKIQVKRSAERGVTVLTIVVTDNNSPESVFVKLYNANERGTFFIPGEGDLQNVGNLIKDVNQFREESNFYQTTLANDEGLKNGVGRVNITKLTKDEVEGELIIIANNSEGKQAQLESARFKARF